MSDTEPTTQPDPQPQGGPTPAAPPQPPEGAPQGGQEPKLSYAELEAELASVRKESASYRTRLRDTEAKLGEAKTADEFEAALATIQSENAAAAHELLAENVALAAGLPAGFGSRLSGADRAALEADAKTLASVVGQQAPPPPPRGSGGLNPHSGGTSAEESMSPAELAKKFASRR